MRAALTSHPRLCCVVGWFVVFESRERERERGRERESKYKMLIVGD